jgi:hypothetical protein
MKKSLVAVLVSYVMLISSLSSVPAGSYYRRATAGLPQYGSGERNVGAVN